MPFIPSLILNLRTGGCKKPLGVIYIILDNALYYRSRTVLEFLENNLRVQLLFLPPYSPELNQIENFCANFKRFVAKITYKFNKLADANSYAFCRQLQFIYL